MSSKSRSRVPTRARRPEDYGSQSAERGAVLGEASLGPLSSPESPSLDRTLVLLPGWSELSRRWCEGLNPMHPAHILEVLPPVLSIGLLPPGPERRTDPGGAACAWFSVHSGCFPLDHVKALLYAH